MYLIRLDDASDHMDIAKWSRMQQILNNYNIKPLVGVIPCNKDPMLCEKFPEDPEFWKLALQWQESGWRIALHGYEHIYTSEFGGINPVHSKSEFAGHTLEEQRRKIRSGYFALKEKELVPTVFFAPSHTFDENTLEALRLETNIRLVSDTAANNVYCEKGFTFIPQQSGRVRILPFALTTICLHPNFTSENEFREIEAFIRKNIEKFIDPNTITETTRRKNIIDMMVEELYFLKRKLRK
ncbi:MAG: DUF2334 domain-containing protein [Clostridia bacterium]|nr:DUF2334 domain-containing protein [Clostridia bacterium]